MNQHTDYKCVIQWRHISLSMSRHEMSVFYPPTIISSATIGPNKYKSSSMFKECSEMACAVCHLQSRPSRSFRTSVEYTQTFLDLTDNHVGNLDTWVKSRHLPQKQIRFIKNGWLTTVIRYNKTWSDFTMKPDKSTPDLAADCSVTPEIEASNAPVSPGISALIRRKAAESVRQWQVIDIGL